MWGHVSLGAGGGFGVRSFKGEMLNVECSMLNVECFGLGCVIQHSTLNIEHSTFAFFEARASHDSRFTRHRDTLRPRPACRPGDTA